MVVEFHGQNRLRLEGCAASFFARGQELGGEHIGLQLAFGGRMDQTGLEQVIADRTSLEALLLNNFIMNTTKVVYDMQLFVVLKHSMFSTRNIFVTSKTFGGLSRC